MFFFHDRKGRKGKVRKGKGVRFRARFGFGVRLSLGRGPGDRLGFTKKKNKGQ
jgi:hypothetical protein